MPYDLTTANNRLPGQLGQTDSDPSSPVVPIDPAGFAYPNWATMGRREGMFYHLVPSPGIARAIPASGGTADLFFEGTNDYWYEIFCFVFQAFAAAGEANAGEPLNTYALAVRTSSPTSRLDPIDKWTDISCVAAQATGRTHEHLWPLPWVLPRNNDLRLQIRNDHNIPLDVAFYAITRRHIAEESE